MDSDNSQTDYEISDAMRKLIIDYMTACNEQKHALAEELLQQIKEQGELDRAQS